MEQNINAMDVIEFLAQGQSQLREHLISTSKSYWNDTRDGSVFFIFLIEIGQNKQLIDWKALFTSIEIVLEEPKFADFADHVATHLLEGFSNSVANGNMDAEILTKNAGPLARKHMKAWELAMSGKTIF